MGRTVSKDITHFDFSSLTDTHKTKISTSMVPISMIKKFLIIQYRHTKKFTQMKYAQLEWPTTYLVAIRILKRPTRHTLLVFS